MRQERGWKGDLNLGSRVPTEGLENTEQLCRKLRKVGILGRLCGVRIRHSQRRPGPPCTVLLFNINEWPGARQREEEVNSHTARLQ